MKANRKFREGEEAVSAVIGVILMVAITVAIAATVFVYVNQMATPTSTAKTMVAMYDDKSTEASGDHDVTYKVTHTDAGISWVDLTASTNGADVTVNKTSGNAWASNDGYVTVGQFFNLSFSVGGTYSSDIIYDGAIIWTSPDVVVN